MAVRLVIAFIVLVLAGAALHFATRERPLPPAPAQAPDPMARIHEKVAADAEIQYGIVSRNGTAMDRCVQAGLAAQAQLQAKNEAAYTTWKKVEAHDCAEAGVSR